MSNTRMENTLWLAGVVTLGVVVTIVVEYVFRRVHPATDLTEGIEVRLQTVENVLRSAARSGRSSSEWEKRLSLYATVGASRLRRLILRSDYSPHFKAQMGTAIALLGRLIDIAASFQLALAERAQPIDHGRPIERCLRLADQIAVLRRNLMLRQLPVKIEGPSQEEPSNLPFLPAMETTVALIPEAFAGSQSRTSVRPCAFGRTRPSALLCRRCVFQPRPCAIRLARHARGHGLLHHLHGARLAGDQYLGTHLLHHRALHHRLIAAEAVPAAWGRVHRRLCLWHGSAGICASLPRYDCRFHACCLRL